MTWSVMPDPTPTRGLIASLTLFILTLLLFWPCVHHDYLSLDDPEYIADNIHVRTGLTPASIRWAFTTNRAANWHPVTWLSHMIDVELYGGKVWGHHLSSVLIHALNSGLLFVVLVALTRRAPLPVIRHPSSAPARLTEPQTLNPATSLWPAVFAAALFAVHPLRVESVAWIAERKDVLSGLFFMLTLLAYTRYVRAADSCRRSVVGCREERPEQETTARIHAGVGAKSDKPLRWYILTLLCFALGLMAKPMLVTLPFVLLLLDHWPLQRIFPATAPEDRARMEPAGSQVSGFSLKPFLEKIPFFALSFASCIVTLQVQSHSGATLSIEALPFGQRLANAAVSYTLYLQKTAWPHPLAVFYPYPRTLPLWHVFAALALLTAISVWIWRRRHTAPYLTIGWLWFIGMLVPVIGLVQVGGQAMADRYTYLPGIGLAIMAAWGWQELGSRSTIRSAVIRNRRGKGRNFTAIPRSAFPLPRSVWALLPAALLGLCVVLTQRYLRHWENNFTLYTHALNTTKDNWLAHHNLASAMADAGQTDAALSHFHACLRIRPRWALARANFGQLLAELGHDEEAAQQYAIALSADPDCLGALCNQGNLYRRQGRIDEAMRFYTRALQIDPASPEVHNNIANTLSEQGQIDDALGHYRTALRLRPHYAEAHNNIGVALGRQGRHPEAIRHYREAVRLDPAYLTAQLNLADALRAAGQLDEARQHYRTILNQQPDEPRARAALERLH